MSKYERVAGRRFRNLETGEVISRRQYDKLEGALSREGFSSFEAKAKANLKANEQEAVLRPARGRTKFKGEESDRGREAISRLDERERKVIRKKAIAKVRRAYAKRWPAPRVTKSKFGYGKYGTYFRGPLSNDFVEDVLSQARELNKALGYTYIFGYLVGFEYINEFTGEKAGATLEGGFQALSMEWTKSYGDIVEGIEAMSEAQYIGINAVNAFVYLRKDSGLIAREQESQKKARVVRESNKIRRGDLGKYRTLPKGAKYNKKGIFHYPPDKVKPRNK